MKVEDFMRGAAITFLAALALAVPDLSLFAANSPGPALEQNNNRDAIAMMQGKPAPALALTKWMNSKSLTLGALRGKIVLLDFWATWCGPCLASVPHNNELQRKYANKGVVFIAVCASKGGEKMEETVRKYGIQYAVALDAGIGDTFVSYQADSFPDYYIIDRKGNLRWGDVQNTEVEKAIKLLIAEGE